MVHDTDQRLFTATIGGRTHVVDNRRVVDLRPGRHLTKDAWSTTLWADGRKPVRLPVGDEAFQFAADLAAGGRRLVPHRRARGCGPCPGRWIRRTGTGRRAGIARSRGGFARFRAGLDPSVQSSSR